MNHDITPTIRAWLDDTISSAPPPVTLERAVAAAVQRSPQRDGWWRRLGFGWPLSTIPATFVVAAAIVALFGGVLLVGVLVQPSGEPTPASATFSPSHGTEYRVTRFPDPGSSWQVLATDDAMWATGEQSVTRIDSVTTEASTIDLPQLTHWFDGSLVATADAVWIVDERGVSRIDREDLTPQSWVSRDHDEPFMPPPLIVDGSLWIASGSNSLVEVDLSEPAIRGEYVDTERWYLAENGALWLGSTGDAIWVGTHGPLGRRLTRFDLGTREFTDRVDGLPLDRNEWGPCCIVGDDAIWVTGTPYVSRLDLATLEITDRLKVGRHLRGGVATPDAIWIVVGEALGSNEFKVIAAVLRIDASSREVTDTIKVRSPEPPALLDGAIWIANHGAASISRIDPESRRMTDVLRVGTHPYTPIGSGGVIWVPTRDGRIARIDSGVGRHAAEAFETE